MQRGLSKRPPTKKVATLKKRKGAYPKDIRRKRGNPKKCNMAYPKDFRRKRGNPEKRKGANSKDLWRKKMQPRKTQRGLFKRPTIKKEAVLKGEEP
jgi:hypothetical protein